MPLTPHLGVGVQFCQLQSPVMHQGQDHNQRDPPWAHLDLETARRACFPAVTADRTSYSLVLVFLISSQDCRDQPHKLDDSKQQESALSKLWRLGVQNQDVGRVLLSPRALSQPLVVVGSPWLVATSLQALPHPWNGLPPHDCIFPVCLSIPPLLIRTPVTGFRVHPEPVLISLNLIICTKALFPKSHSRMPTQGVGTSIKISGRHMSTYSFFFIFIHLFIWLHLVLAMSCRIFAFLATGFSLFRVASPWHRGSRVHGFSSSVHGLSCRTVWNTTFYPSCPSISFTPEKTLIHPVINRSLSLITSPLTSSLTHHWVYLHQSLLVSVQNSIPARQPTLQESHLVTSTLRNITDPS